MPRTGGRGGRDGLVPLEVADCALAAAAAGRSRWGGRIPSACVRDDAQDGRASTLPQEDSPNSERLLGEGASGRPPEQDGDGLCLLSGDTPSRALRETVSSVELSSELGSADPPREAALDALVPPLRCSEMTPGPRCSPRLGAGASARLRQRGEPRALCSSTSSKLSALA